MEKKLALIKKMNHMTKASDTVILINLGNLTKAMNIEIRPAKIIDKGKSVGSVNGLKSIGITIASQITPIVKRNMPNPLKGFFSSFSLRPIILF